mgnify:CR=1 FL=1
MSDQLEALKDFKVTVEIPVAWGEMDSYKHVNNVIFFRYFECAQVKYFDVLGYKSEFERLKIGAVIQKNTCTYLIPLTYPDQVTVGAKISDIQDNVLFFEFYILSSKSGLSAFGESEMVLFDFAASKKINIPEELKQKIETFENTKF